MKLLRQSRSRSGYRCRSRSPYRSRRRKQRTQQVNRSSAKAAEALRRVQRLIFLDTMSKSNLTRVPGPDAAYIKTHTDRAHTLSEIVQNMLDQRPGEIAVMNLEDIDRIVLGAPVEVVAKDVIMRGVEVPPRLSRERYRDLLEISPELGMWIDTVRSHWLKGYRMKLGSASPGTPAHFGYKAPSSFLQLHKGAVSVRDEVLKAIEDRFSIDIDTAEKTEALELAGEVAEMLTRLRELTGGRELVSSGIIRDVRDHYEVNTGLLARAVR